MVTSRVQIEHYIVRVWLADFIVGPTDILILLFVDSF